MSKNDFIKNVLFSEDVDFVEKELGKLGIELRSDNGMIKSFHSIMEELSEVYNS